MKLVNLTPHAVTLLAEGFATFDSKAKCYRLPSTMTPFVLAEFPSAGVARCAVSETLLGEQDVDGLDFSVPFVGVTFGERISEMRVLKGTVMVDGHECWVLSTRQRNAPEGVRQRRYHYFDIHTLEHVYV